ncbi:methyl-accepting chemotaxis protein [bacterium]|nr:methyl-accepting chemotaxis protein [bacterium]
MKKRLLKNKSRISWLIGRKPNLRSRLYFISVGMIILLSSILTYEFEHALEAQEQEIQKGFLLYTDTLSASISKNFYANYHNVQALAKNPVLKGETKADKEFMLNEYVSLFPVTRYVLLLGADGNIVARSTIDGSGKALNKDALQATNFSSERWFSDMKEEKLVEDYDKNIFGTLVSDTIAPAEGKKLTGKDIAGNYFVTRLEDDFGDVLGYLAAFVDNKWVETELSNLGKSLKESGKSEITIMTMNKSGLLTSLYEDTTARKGVFRDSDSFLSWNVNEVNHPVNSLILNKKRKTIEGKGLFSTPESKENSEYLFAVSPISNQNFVDTLDWKVIITMDSTKAYATIGASSAVYYTALCLGLFVCLSFSIYIVRNLASKLTEVISSVKGSTQNTIGFVEKLGHTSNEMSRVSSYQASATHQTVTTLQVFETSVAENSEAANGMSSDAKMSEQKANEGKNIVTTMIDSIRRVQQTNKETQIQVDGANRDFKEIVKIIKNIAEETDVINEIAFQTKVLSFNASVEASRAGEMGKGFGVVAEEVGNLAEMSNGSANKIRSILTSSIEKVEHIIKNNQQNIESSIQDGSARIEQAIAVSDRCQAALNEIITTSKVVTEKTVEISNASNEQLENIRNIRDAMDQLDQTIQDNTNVASDIMKISDSMKSISSGLDTTVNELQTEVHGSKGNAESPAKSKKNGVSKRQERRQRNSPMRNDSAQEQKSKTDYKTAI